jgi:uncharacterized protein with FMN-binding domain
MRKSAVVTCTAATGLVLLFAWQTTQNDTAGPTRSTPEAVKAASPSSTPTGSNVTYDGAPAETRYGTVVVEIRVVDGKITAADAIEHPYTSDTDKEINDRAVPILNDEVLKAQSGEIDMVSGATFTSTGYIQSLQDALDQANL